MTVAELIAELHKHAPDAEVLIEIDVLCRRIDRVTSLYRSWSADPAVLISDSA